MFQSLNEKLGGVFKSLKGQARITEDNIQDAIKQVRMALLEADVNYKVVKSFVAGVKERAVGEEVTKSLSPDQVFIKIVNDELVKILGGDENVGKINLNPHPPTIILMAGLQGSGKTTTAGKLAGHFMKSGKSVMLAACDIYRPAAIDQLEVLGRKLKADVYADRDCKDAVKIASDALEQAKKTAKDILIVDTAGRLHIDEQLMDELVSIKKAVNPDEVLFVADAMTGQDAVNVAKTFNDAVDATGVVLTKLDGDARGGAALSIREVTGKPVKFVGLGEKLDEFEQFYPDRMASRILGMGDIVSLVERAQDAIDEDEAEDMMSRISKKGMNFEDMLSQFKMIKKMGSLESILKMIPGMGNKMANMNVDDGQLKKIEAIIFSMTPAERKNAKLLNANRKKRIAGGSGTRVSDINKLANQLQQMNKMMKQMNKKMGGRKPNPAMLKDMFKGMGM